MHCALPGLVCHMSLDSIANGALRADRACVWNYEPSSRNRDEIEQLIASLASARVADEFNVDFAADVIWGNPGGGVVHGFETLHAIHERIFAGPMKDRRSRFVLVSLAFHGDDVAVAHVRREPLDAEGRTIDTTASPDPADFQEMAMYVLVKRAKQWWLAAGQNTPVRPSPIRIV